MSTKALMRTSRIHFCFQQHLGEQKPDTCRCRKLITTHEATKMVREGRAQWVVLSRRPVVVEETCPVCDADESKRRSCQNCKGLGTSSKTYYQEEYSEDVVMAVMGSKDEDGNEVFRSVMAKQTPRVATIEKTHIERAYIEKIKEDQQRIEAYGLDVLEARVTTGIDNHYVEIKPEPEDSEELGTGRRYDWGRAIFARQSNDRTPGGIGEMMDRCEKCDAIIVDGSCECSSIQPSCFSRRK